MGRRDEALYVLKRLRGSANERSAIQEMREIESIVELEHELGHNITYFHMLFGIGDGDLHIACRVQLVIWLQILQSWSGIASITKYIASLRFSLQSTKVLIDLLQFSRSSDSIPKRECGSQD